MKTVFRIKDGIIGNVTVEDEDWHLWHVGPGEMLMETNGVNGVGDNYDAGTGEFSKPTPPAPPTP